MVFFGEIYKLMSMVAKRKKDKEEKEKEEKKEPWEKYGIDEHVFKMWRELHRQLGQIIVSPHPKQFAEEVLPRLDEIIKIAEKAGYLKIGEDGKIEVVKDKEFFGGLISPEALWLAHEIAKDKPEMILPLANYIYSGALDDPRMPAGGERFGGPYSKWERFVDLAKEAAERGAKEKLRITESPEKKEEIKKVLEFLEEVKKKDAELKKRREEMERELFPWWKLFLENIKKKERMHVNELKELIMHLETAEKILAEAESHLVERGELDPLKLGMLIELLVKKGYDETVAEYFKLDVEEMCRGSFRQAVERVTAARGMVQYVKGMLSVIYAEKIEMGEEYLEAHEVSALHAKLTDVLAELHGRYRRGWYRFTELHPRNQIGNRNSNACRKQLESGTCLWTQFS